MLLCSNYLSTPRTRAVCGVVVSGDKRDNCTRVRARLRNRGGVTVKARLVVVSMSSMIFG